MIFPEDHNVINRSTSNHFTRNLELGRYGFLFAPLADAPAEVTGAQSA
jgi:hypothetical protein